ncbi:UDP-glucose 4-epimerase GalE [Sulfitobacter sp. KE34]|nr:UDP-glucose 4-epimerase GalE [Sulfitobacter sp. KE12]MDF3355489.1 UDP-glucose 4-epimerase GalE [Sulfitobacter sp. KE27]MDF3359137.1 UDP-glucose 4-epimerase GalE [Sulfitobacter sp. KE33]MDF3366561.1 UDP-glucose 4-epimerase GalE [Sulfitobacter sp. Ks34]MDF3370170.1 UDP-glucose 4-epimerase GalE [Sulfitobacter sp. Ks43]MDF3373966.1 UDP-glucose 4-epimerase GalE [Sulfitobacter sp. KS8]MDF3377456.1 UDP-glucose 4-epimerase GalE [Sulfitobacter sp. KE37]MDF3381122.1 UDP-glucose 4-epimerase GalE [Su
MNGRILTTGGAGYIGSHTTVELLKAGHSVVILDNFENSDRDRIARIPLLSGTADVRLVEGDVRDAQLVADVLKHHKIDAVIHFAGKKAVSESVADPLLYYHDNITGAVSVLSAMRDVGCDKLIFSSSATVYGNTDLLPTPETAPTSISNPYGRTKLMIEDIIDDTAASLTDFRALSLRYFNPVGAHSSGLIGECPRGVPNNLFPYIAQAAAGIRDHVQIHGGDYETCDGTGSRDYIHVVDLARGHVAAVEHLLSASTDFAPHCRVNLGTGQGHTVLQVLHAFSEACGFQIPYRIGPRRSGDVASSLADPSLGRALFNWQPKFDLKQMCRDHWNFQKCERDKAENGTKTPLFAHDTMSEIVLNSRHLALAGSRDVLN